MSDRIVESLNEMKQIYLESVSGQVISKRDEYLQYIEEKMKMKKKDEEEVEDKEDEEDEEDEEDKDEEDKPNRWWDDDGDGIGYEKGEVSGKFNKKKKSVKESFSDWRYELYEKVGNVEADIEDLKQRKIEERSDIKNKIDINPNVNIGEQVELSEEYIEEVIDIAAQYFYEQGLNEEGLVIVIEELGYDNFLELVFEIGHSVIEEESVQGELLTSAGKARKDPKITKRPGAATPVGHIPSKKEAEAKTPSKQSPGQLELNFRPKVERRTRSQGKVKSGSTRVGAGPKIQVDKRNKAIETAAKTQPKGFENAAGQVKKFVTSPDTQARLRDTLSAVVNRAKSDIGKTGMAAIHATGAAKKARQRGASGVGAAGAAAGTFLRGLMRGSTATGVREEIESFLLEKSESQQQQKLFGLALSVKRGETPRSEVSQAVLDIVDEMSEKQIRKFAKTPHKGLPKKVED
jgi:hypothetical protein